MTPRILAIETSCDETACALWADGRIIGERVHIQRHADFGGVVPEMASRAHCRHLLPMVAALLSETGIAPTHIAYTRGPGLSGALLTGAAVANALAFARGIPAVAVNHLTGHLLSPHLSVSKDDLPNRSAKEFKFPYLALLVSGGHTQLWEVHSPLDCRILGATLDDAAGEAFDKTAVLLGLSYPGGADLEKLAKDGDVDFVSLPSPAQPQLNFSFSGLKTAVRRQIERFEKDSAPENWRAGIAASFQKVAAEGLAKQSSAALTQTGFNRLTIVGGVAQNHAVWQALETFCKGAQLHRPHPRHCGDNAAMIAQAAAMQLQAKEDAGMPLPVAGDYSFDVDPRWLEVAGG